MKGKLVIENPGELYNFISDEAPIFVQIHVKKEEERISKFEILALIVNID